jgi:preprotein translocase subunit SecA
MEQVVVDKVAYYFNLDVPAPGQEAADGESTPGHPVDEFKRWLKTVYGIVVDDLGVDLEKPLADQTEIACQKTLEAYDRFYEDKRARFGPEVMGRIERYLLLLKMDEKWKDHLRAMDQLRSGIGLRSYGQIDPKVAYKQEGYDMFSQMVESLRNEVTQLVLRVEVRREDEERLKSGLEKAEFKHEGQPVDKPSEVATAGSGDGPRKPIVNKGPKVGRNDPCPCGSGKKYKHCCGMGKK